MTEIIKADKNKKARAYVILFIIVITALFVQTDYFSSLVSIDTSGMSLGQKIYAEKQELKYASVFIFVIFLIMSYFSYRLILTAKKVLIEKRYPPTNFKVVVDTKVVYGKKAKFTAVLMILGAVLLPSNSLFRAYTIYYSYGVMDDLSKSHVDTQNTINQYYTRLISEKPNSVSAIEYYLKIGKMDEAVKLIERLINEGNDEAIFAKASEGLSGEYLTKDIENSIHELTSLCSKYVEPCLSLAIYYKEEKQYDLSLEYFLKAESKDYTRVYREIRYLYNRSNLNDRDKLNEYTDKMNSAKYSLCDEIYCLTVH